MYWSLNSPDDGTQKLGLWEIIGFERDLGNPHDGISISGKLQKIFHCVRIQQDSGYLQKRKGTLTNKLITLQERILEWVVMLFSMASSWLRNWTCVSCIAGGFFKTVPPWWGLSKRPLCILNSSPCISASPIPTPGPIKSHFSILMLMNHSGILLKCRFQLCSSGVGPGILFF